MAENNCDLPASQKKRTFGGIGLIIGFAALALAVMSPYLIEVLEPPKALEDSVAETSIKIRDKVKDAILKGKVEKSNKVPAPLSSSKYVPFLALSSGLIAILFGLGALLKREDRFIAGTAIALGGSAIIAQYAILLAGALIFAIIVAAVLVNLD